MMRRLRRSTDIALPIRGGAVVSLRSVQISLQPDGQRIPPPFGYRKVPETDPADVVRVVRAIERSIEQYPQSAVQPEETPDGDDQE
jgi:hypothetical protein